MINIKPFREAIYKAEATDRGCIMLDSFHLHVFLRLIWMCEFVPLNSHKQIKPNGKGRASPRKIICLVY